MWSSLKKLMKEKMGREEISKHKRKLFNIANIENDDYKEYLDLQLARSFSKKSNTLADRNREFIDIVAREIELQFCRVLCVGCRNSSELDYMKRKGAKSAHGIDLFSECQDIVVMDMHDMKFPDNEFDLIFSAHSLEHAHSISKVVNEMLRVVKNNGYIAIEVPVKYQTRGADIVDFDNLDNLHEIFSPFIAEYVWSETNILGSDEPGTSTIRTIFRVEKP